MTLPEIRIPWWDTRTDSQKMAVIPARTFQVQAVPGQPVTTVSQPESGGQSEPQPAETEASVEAATQAASSGIWQTVALILLVAWLITGFGWWYSRRRQVGTTPPAQRTDGTEKALFSTLCESAMAGAPETPDHLIRWTQHLQPQHSIVSLEAVYRALGNNVVDRKIRELQARSYRQQAAAESWQGEQLVEALSLCREKMKARHTAKSPLPALYPDELSAR
jgi:hypothetical protein